MDTIILLVLTTTNVVLTFGSNEFGNLLMGLQKAERQMKKSQKKIVENWILISCQKMTLSMKIIHV